MAQNKIVYILSLWFFITTMLLPLCLSYFSWDKSSSIRLVVFYLVEVGMVSLVYFYTEKQLQGLRKTTAMLILLGSTLYFLFGLTMIIPNFYNQTDLDILKTLWTALIMILGFWFGGLIAGVSILKRQEKQ